MQFIAHRINTIADLRTVPKEYGVEIDVRVDVNSIILGHDPGLNGVEINEFLKYFEHYLLIINVKTEKIEKNIIDILRDKNISNYFFLDSSMSSIVQLSPKAEKKFSGRISEFESIESIKLSKDLVDWVWVDCFTKFSLTTVNFQILKDVLNKKICLTSPDLVGRPEDIALHAHIIRSLGCFPDAICCKLGNIEKWKQELLIS
jgi:hypothetical protein